MDYIVKSPSRGRIAAFKYAEDAAMFIAGREDHRIRDNVTDRLLWHEGAEAFSAGESVDRAARIMNERKA